MNGDIWVARARLQCGGCEDVAEIRKDVTWSTFVEAVQAFDKRHERCPRQAKLAEASDE